jgi:hypothetical protein
MPIWVRNLLTPFTQDGRGCNHVIAITEMLRVAGYTYDSDDGDANWANNILVNEPGGGNGFEVAAANPRQIYDPLGRFTAAMAGTDSDGACISLLATNEENRSCWKITEFIDANNVLIDEWGENPDAWTDETDIPGRIWTQNAGAFAADSWMILDAPAPSKLQAVVWYDTSSWMDFFVRPAGQDGDPTEAGAGYSTGINNYYTNRVRAQMYADGFNVFICWIDQDGNADVMGWGELEVEDLVADPYPGFVLVGKDVQGQADYNYDVRMIDEFGTSQQAYLDVLKRDWDMVTGVAIGDALDRRIINNRVALMRRPNVVMWGSVRYPRGKLPDFFASSNKQFENERPLDRAGNWFMWRQGVAIHRNGPDDPLLVRPPAS